MYDVFISYRRDGGHEMARFLYEKLKGQGIRCFFDLEELGSGQFNTKLLSCIEQSDNFVLILSKDSLERCKNEGDWVRCEIEHAILLGKNIVPFVLEGFSWPRDLPESLRDLPYYNNVQMMREYFDASIERLVGMLNIEKRQEEEKETSAEAPTVNSLLRRAFLFLEDGEWENADEYCEKVLDIDPESARAYLGKLCVEFRLRTVEELTKYSGDLKDVKTSRSYGKITQFDRDLADEVDALIVKNLERQRQTLERKLRAEQMKQEREEAEQRRSRELYAELLLCEEKLSQKGKLEKEIENLRKKLASQARLKNNWEKIEENVRELSAQIEGVQAEISRVDTERKKIGLFSLKKKKENEQEASALARQETLLQKELETVQKRIDKNKSPEHVADEMQKIDGQIAQKEKELLKYPMFLSPDPIRTEMERYELGKRILALHDASVGDRIKLGKYRQDQEISWNVLDRTGSKLLLVSAYTLVCRPFHGTETDVLWETCSLRSWLNGEFLETAFSEEEREMIEESSPTSLHKNPGYPDSGKAKKTKEKLFLLSLTQFMDFVHLFTDPEIITPYAADRSAEDDRCDWWLSTQGGREHYAAYVRRGVRSYIPEDCGASVTEEKGVRPAMWIDLMKL